MIKSKKAYMQELLILRKSILEVLDIINNEVIKVNDPKTNTLTFALTSESILKILKLLTNASDDVVEVLND